MKILVFSDSHGTTAVMIDAIETHAPDLVLHLGDVLRDAEKLGQYYPKLAMVTVSGNCDGFTTDPLFKCITVNGCRILLSHGHIWHVKNSYASAFYAGRKAEADVLLFGHTHIPYCSKQEEMWVMNPGAASSSYGIIMLENGKIDCKLMSD